jgi:nanoRNase/pAp phosphatase (c-di-AMP/oligoRNAs hydrolase)
MRPDERIPKLLSVLEGKKALVIQTHNNPDPDGIGSAAGLRHLVGTLTDIEPVIAFGGIVGRAANRAMLRILQIQMIHLTRCDYSQYDALAIVDSQPTTEHSGLPGDLRPTIVIDHHPVTGDLSGIPYVDIGGRYGATSTIITEMLRSAHLQIPEPIATALTYGIRSDTQDLGRETSQADIEACTTLYPSTDKRALSRIESERVPEEYFQAFQRAIKNAHVYDNIVLSDLGAVRAPDIVAEMADFLLRLENMRWSAVMGHFEDTLHVSVRCSTPRSPGAGAVVRTALGGIGSAGGHGAMAGGQVSLDGLSEEDREALRSAVVDRLLKALDGKRTLRRPLGL